jgi:uncharacterized membrane protein YedE/YeeE
LLSILTFLVLSPALVAYFSRDPLEVSFAYPRPDRPKLELVTIFGLQAILFGTQLGSFVISIMTAVAIFKKQRWAWFVGIGVHVLITTVYLIAVYLLPPYVTNDRIATIVIAGTSLYLLSRREVRTYLKILSR